MTYPSANLVSGKSLKTSAAGRKTDLAKKPGVRRTGWRIPDSITGTSGTAARIPSASRNPGGICANMVDHPGSMGCAGGVLKKG